MVHLKTSKTNKKLIRKLFYLIYLDRDVFYIITTSPAIEKEKEEDKKQGFRFSVSSVGYYTWFYLTILLEHFSECVNILDKIS